MTEHLIIIGFLAVLWGATAALFWNLGAAKATKQAIDEYDGLLWEFKHLMRVALTCKPVLEDYIMRNYPKEYEELRENAKN